MLPVLLRYFSTLLLSRLKKKGMSLFTLKMKYKIVFRPINLEKKRKDSPHGGVANVMHFETFVSEFKFQSCYNVHFRINNLSKGVNSLNPPAMA